MDDQQPQDEQPHQDEQKKQRKPKPEACPDCVRNGKSTGLKDARTLCSTCEGSGSVAVV